MTVYVVVVALCVALGACGGQDDPETAGTTQETPEEPTVVTYEPFKDLSRPELEAYFIELEDTPLAERLGPERLYAIGVEFCEALDADVDVEAAFAGIEVAHPVRIVDSASDFICDQHRDLVVQWAEDTGRAG